MALGIVDFCIITFGVILLVDGYQEKTQTINWINTRRGPTKTSVKLRER